MGKQTRVGYEYTLSREVYGQFVKGEPLTIDEENNYNDIPEHCPECHCVQSVNYREFSNKRIQVCEQCGNEMYLQ